MWGENTRMGAPRNSGLDGRPEEIIAITQRICAQHLDLEYSRLCAKLVRALARHCSSPLEGGQTKVWAGAVLCAIGEVNFFFSPAQRPHIKFDELSRLTGVSKSALATRARFIMNLLRIMPSEPAYRRREQLVPNTLNHIVEKANQLELDDGRQR
jgi:Domain of unknown function (DUF6398)